MIDLLTGDRRRFMGQLATRCYIPTNKDSTPVYMSRTFHYARDNITHLKIGHPGWYVPQGPGAVETASGGTTSIRASIEYPAGVFHQLLFGGVALGSIASGVGVIGWSDLLPVNIPNGAIFYVRMQLSNTSGIPYNVGTSGARQATAFGDALQQTGTDLTMSGTITDGFGTSAGMFPIAIVGWTNRASIAIWGDSRQAGLGDATVDASGEQGEIGRALGYTLPGGLIGYPYINLGVPGDRTQDFIASHTARLAISQYCTHVICGLGINELASATLTAAQVETNVATIAAYARPRPFIYTTLPPETTSTDSWATVVNQTLNSSNAAVQSFNTWVRAKTAPLDGFIDVASIMESGGAGAPSGKWNAPGFTTDGIHETSLANLDLLSANAGPVVAGLIPPGGFGYMPMT